MRSAAERRTHRIHIEIKINVAQLMKIKFKDCLEQNALDV